MNTLSWIHDFEKKYGHDTLLQDVKGSRMHGSIQINFCNGAPVNYNITIHRRASMTYANTVSNTTTSASTSNQGESDGDNK